MNLVHLFKPVFGRLALIFFLLISNLASAKLLVRDRALFRIERQVFFKEGFLQWVEEWKSLSCAGHRSMLLASLELEGGDFRGIPDLLNALENRSATSVERKSIERLVRLVKLLLYVQTQPANKDQTWPKTLRCVGAQMQKNSDLQLVARAENFLRERFRTEKKRSYDDDMIRARAFLESVLRGQSDEIYL